MQEEGLIHQFKTQWIRTKDPQTCSLESSQFSLDHFTPETTLFTLLLFGMFASVVCFSMEKLSSRSRFRLIKRTNSCYQVDLEANLPGDSKFNEIFDDNRSIHSRVTV